MIIAILIILGKRFTIDAQRRATDARTTSVSKVPLGLLLLLQKNLPLGLLLLLLKMFPSVLIALSSD